MNDMKAVDIAVEYTMEAEEIYHFLKLYAPVLPLDVISQELQRAEDCMDLGELWSGIHKQLQKKRRKHGKGRD